MTSQILDEFGFELNGIHLEASPLDITECIYESVEDEILKEKYTTKCDPRLNYK